MKLNFEGLNLLVKYSSNDKNVLNKRGFSQVEIDFGNIAFL